LLIHIAGILSRAVNFMMTCWSPFAALLQYISLIYDPRIPLAIIRLNVAKLHPGAFVFLQLGPLVMSVCATLCVCCVLMSCQRAAEMARSHAHDRCWTRQGSSKQCSILSCT